MMTKDDMKTWFRDIFFPTTTNGDNFLVVDSWSSFKDRDTIKALRKQAPGQTSLGLLNIPAGGTSMCQPLDVYFFRPYKNLVRRVAEGVFIEGLEDQVKIYQRDNILKLQSLCHNQFSYERFSPLIRYA